MKKALQYQYFFLILFSLLIGNFGIPKADAQVTCSSWQSGSVTGTASASYTPAGITPTAAECSTWCMQNAPANASYYCWRYTISGSVYQQVVNGGSCHVFPGNSTPTSTIPTTPGYSVTSMYTSCSIASVPTVTLSASPTSVSSGGSSTLTWSSVNATSCTGTNFSTGGATSGNRSTGALTSTTTYSVTCTGAGGSASASRTVTVTAPTNTAPNAPAITGPTTGAPNTSYSFAFRASDPNGDTVRYGIDWDNNNTVDAWLPASGYVASNTSQSSTRSWTSTGAKTFKAQTQDSKGAASGWTTHTITLSNPVNSPTLNFTINNSTGPLDVALGANLNLVWSATNVTSCTGYGNNWTSGSSVGISGNTNISATASDSYIVNCTGANGNISRSITVNLANTLKVCQNSCNSGIQRGNTSTTQSFTLAQGGTQNLVSCFNPSSSCNDASGNVTGSTTWGEQGGNNTVALSGTDPKTVTGNNGGSENISASYSSQTNNMTVNVACLPTVSCDNAPGRENYCQSDTFTVDNGCGVTLNCNGTKSCNYNWKEVAP